VFSYHESLVPGRWRSWDRTSPFRRAPATTPSPQSNRPRTRPALRTCTCTCGRRCWPLGCWVLRATSPALDHLRRRYEQRAASRRAGAVCKRTCLSTPPLVAIPVQKRAGAAIINNVYPKGHRPSACMRTYVHSMPPALLMRALRVLCKFRPTGRSVWHPSLCGVRHGADCKLLPIAIADICCCCLLYCLSQTAWFVVWTQNCGVECGVWSSLDDIPSDQVASTALLKSD
jgi:hypothetical protein